MSKAHEFKLTLASELREINRICRSLDDFCAVHAVGRSSERVLHIVLEELISNTVSHGAVPATAPIDVCLKFGTQCIELEYIDRGRPFDPLQDVPPDTRDMPLEKRSVGGLGWPLIFSYCVLDGYRYTNGENHYTFLIRTV